MRVLCATFNAGAGQAEDDFEPWLVHYTSGEQPDIVAVAFQEAMTLPLALSQLGDTVHLSRKIKAGLSKYPEPYTPVDTISIGAIQLFLYIKRSIRREYASQMQSLGCGPFFMSNKGAVGIRLDIGGKDRSEGFIFVAAHLTAHEHNVTKRNRNWENLVRRMVFYDNSQIYETDHLFVMGDLNYRVDDRNTNDQKFWPDIDERRTLYFKHDQLERERTAGNTMHHLKEPALDFRPTYKYVKGVPGKFDSKRMPAWCDRILYLSRADIKVERYASIMPFISSDHKPVYALFETSEIDPSSEPLPDAPFPQDPALAVKAGIGMLFDLSIGVPWTVMIYAGFGRADVGFVILLMLFMVVLLPYRHYFL